MGKYLNVKTELQPLNESWIIGDFINFKKYKYKEISYAKELFKKLNCLKVDANGATVSCLEKNHPEAVLTLIDGTNEWIEVVSVVCEDHMKQFGNSNNDEEIEGKEIKDEDIQFILKTYREYQENLIQSAQINITKKIDKYSDLVQKYDKGILLVHIDVIFGTLKNRRELAEYIVNAISSEFINNQTFKEIYVYSSSFPYVINEFEEVKIIPCAFYKTL